MSFSDAQVAKLNTIFSLFVDFMNTLKKPTNISINFPFKGEYGQSQGFGDNPNLYARWGYKAHFGIDFLTPWGTPILAVDSGQVVRAGYSQYNGNFVEIDHGWGQSLYLHFKDFPLVKVGDAIKQGDTLGYAGNTGYVIPAPTKDKPMAGTHLHFSIRVNGIKNPEYKDFVDPAPYFKTA